MYSIHLSRGVVHGRRLVWLAAALLLAGCRPDAEPADERGPPVQSATVAAPTTAADSVAVALTGIMATQERILARLDSMEAAGPAAEAAGTGGTGDSAPGDQAGGIDLEEARDEVTNLGLAIFWSILVLVLFRFAIRGVIWILETLAERSVRRRLTFKWLIPITRMLLWGVAAYLIVRTIFRVDAQGILAASAALGVALGFAAQDLLKNVFGGLIWCSTSRSRWATRSRWAGPTAKWCRSACARPAS